ncbi:MAG: hypothetical protein EBS18_03880, partial [Actinobacteria bacterium]|nr:hypothetical protein [Actinomycetota bacterium]
RPAGGKRGLRRACRIVSPLRGKIGLLRALSCDRGAVRAAAQRPGATGVPLGKAEKQKTEKP